MACARTCRLSLLALLVAASACSSTGDLQVIRGQLADVQQQLLLLNEQGATRGTVDQLQSTLEQELGTVVRAEADTREELRRIATQLESLRAKVDEAVAGLGDVTRELAATTAEVEALQVAFDRIRTAPPQSEGGTPADQEEQSADALYQASREHFLRGEYDEAIRGFRRYLESHPITDLADNAQYWIAESYFNQGKFHQAVAEFDRVEQGFPSSERLASALLRKGYAFLELGDTAQGRQALQTVIGRFPRSDEAKLAQRQLDSLAP